MQNPNPYIAGNIDELTDAMIVANKDRIAKYPETQFSIKHALAGGDLVAVHGNY